MAAAPSGKIYLAVGESGTDNGGTVQILDGTKLVPFAKGLGEPTGITTFGGFVFVADRTRVWRIDPRGEARVLSAVGAFPIAAAVAERCDGR